MITAVKKVPAIPSLLLATTVGSILAMIFQKASLVDVLNVLQNGYVGETNVEIVNKLLTRGGVNGMLWTISLIIFALCFGGILEKAKFTEVILEKVIKYIHSVGSLVATTIVTGILCDFVLTDQYLANIMMTWDWKDIIYLEHWKMEVRFGLLCFHGMVVEHINLLL